MSNDSSPAEANDLAARVVELEQKLTFQQAAYDHLNEVVLEQQAALERLRRETKSLRELLQGFVDRGLGEDLPHEKPPHY